MNCKSAEYYISLQLDGVLDKETEGLLSKHIEACEHCNIYLAQAKELHELAKELFTEESTMAMCDTSDIMNDIYKENTSFRIRRLRLKPAAVAAVLALMMVFIPINSKPVLAHGIDWVRSLIIRQPGLVMMVEDRDTLIEREPQGGKEKVLRTDDKLLKTVDEVMAIAYEAEKKPCLPEVMVEGYVFDSAVYGKYLNDESSDFYIESYYIKEDDPSAQKDNINVALKYTDLGAQISRFEAAISKTEQAKEITAGGEKGILIKRDSRAGFNIYQAYFILSKQGAKLEIRYSTKQEAANAENDIIMIAAPLLDKIKEEAADNSK